MPAKSFRAVLLTVLGLSLLMPPPAPAKTVHAAPARPVSHAAAVRSTERPPATTVVVWYQGQEPPADVMRVIDELRQTGQVEAVDEDEGPGRIFVLGEEDAVYALEDLAGVAAVTAADDPPAKDVAGLAHSRSTPPAAARSRPDPPTPFEEPQSSLPVLEPESRPADAVQRAPPERRAGPQRPPLEPTEVPTATLAVSSPDADGEITGVVTADDGGAALEDVQICAYQSSPYVYACDATDASGAYSITVPEGEYRVTFTPDDYHIPEYYDDVPLSESGDYVPVDVSAGGVTAGIDAGLAPGAQIKGQVTAEGSGNPIANAAVYAESLDGGSNSAGDYTDGDGKYATTPGLPLGSYRLVFNDYIGGEYAQEYYNDAYRPDEATALAITTNHLTGVDIALGPAAAIEGVVTGPDPLEGIGVSVYYADLNEYVIMAYTDETGAYRLIGLSPISYKLRLWDSTDRYLTEWHQDQPSWESADPIPLTAGVTETVDVELTAGAVVHGTVTAEEDGTPLEGMGVTLYEPGGRAVQGDRTDASGAYRLEALDSGDYKLYVYDYDDRYLGEFYDDKPDLASADEIAVTAGTTTTIDVALTQGAVITGTVTEEESGDPLEGIDVTVYDALDDVWIENASTDGSGRYRIGGLASGAYKLRFSDSDDLYLEEYHADKADLPSADAIDVTAGTTTTVDAQLTAAGIIEGQVTAEESGTPLDNVNVRLYRAGTNAYVTSDTSDASGRYHVAGLETGAYKMRFRDLDGKHITEFYDDKPSLDSADEVDVSAGTVTTIDVAMTEAGVLKGRVTAEGSGAGVEGINVAVYEAGESGQIASNTTDGSGAYRLGSMSSGSYHIRFYDPTGRYLTEYHDDKPDRESADGVSVTAGMTTTIDAELAQAAVFQGTVTAEGSGAPLEGMRVYLYEADTNDFAGSDSTDGSGMYRVGGLAAGFYKVRFNDPGGVYLTEYYDDQQNRASANPVEAVQGMTTTVDAELTLGAAIAGRVTAEESGVPLDGITVQAYEAGTRAYVGSGRSDASGRYRVAPLRPGSYKLRFYDGEGPYLAEYHQDKQDLTTADPVAVTAGMTTTVDAELAPGTLITGRVVDADTGLGIGGVSVRVERQDGDAPYNSTTTDSDGNYTTTSLYPGVYRVRFRPPAPYYQEYYDNQRISSAFTPVLVTGSPTVTGIDAALTAGHVISGMVTSGDGSPLEGVEVHAYRGGDDRADARLSTDSEGRYQLGPLAPGPYRIFFQSLDEHQSEWYQDAATHPEAEVIELTGSTAGVDAELALGSRITGTVTGPGGAPLEGVVVTVYPARADQSVASGESGADGRYTTAPGLRPGLYQVRFSAPPGYTDEWYADKPGWGEATIINVSGVGDVTSVDAELASYDGGTIRGTVTAADTGFNLNLWVYAYDEDGSNVRSDYASGGEYELDELRPGSYRIRFSASAPYVAVYYGGALDLAGADPVVVAAGETVADVDQVVPVGGVVTGRVIGGGGGLPGVFVYTRRVAGSYDAESTYTGLDGSYRLARLEGGDYKVEFAPPAPWIGEWYQDAVTQGTADTIPVTLSGTTPGVDAELVSGGTIRGTITAADTGAPLPGAYVDVYSGTLELVDYVYADMDGAYQTRGLAAGDYHVRFDEGGWHGYRAEWYEDAPSRDAGDAVTVGASGTSDGVDGTLERGGAISGWTYDAGSGEPLDGVYVRVVESGSGAYASYDYTNDFGFYRVEALSSGSYHVKFSEEGYADQWYDRASDRSTATAVIVTAPGDATDVDGHLRGLGAIYLPMVMRGG